jgi:hypothetical protein
VLNKSGTVLTRHASQAGRAGDNGRYGSDLLTVRGTAKPVKLMRTRPTHLGGLMFLAASVGNRAPLSGGGGSRGVLPRQATTPADSRCSRRRSAGGDGGTTLFCSAIPDEDGGNLAHIAASGASNPTERDARAGNNRLVQRTRRTAWRISQTRLHTDSAVASVAVRLSVFTQLPQPAFTRQPRWRRTVVGVNGHRCICAHSVDICVEVSEVVVPHAPMRQGVGAHNSRSLLRVSGSRSGAPRLRSHQ